MKRGKAPYVPSETLASTLAAQGGRLHAQRDSAILLLSHYLGLRAIELAGLLIQDVYDPTAGDLREIVRLTITKGGKFREVFLVNELARAGLRLYLRERGTRRGDAPLFLSQRGGPFSANTMQRLMAICYRRAGVRASSHSGRRSFATNLIYRGADIYSIMELMGHSSISTTQEYFSSSPVRLRQAAALLA